MEGKLNCALAIACVVVWGLIGLLVYEQLTG